jgi:hypothetical protein
MTGSAVVIVRKRISRIDAPPERGQVQGDEAYDQSKEHDERFHDLLPFPL